MALVADAGQSFGEVRVAGRWEAVWVPAALVPRAKAGAIQSCRLKDVCNPRHLHNFEKVT
ncbi:MAG TPA: hypothetical protein VFD58_03850 [Blastocatellia bacterium]|nr:hypothetical protein [Blastocatellia bacterium]